MRISRLALAAVSPLLLASTVDAPRDIAGALHGRLVAVQDGRLAPRPVPVRARYVAFYFGASWCAPCRALMPDLKRSYARMHTAGAPVEIVFVSDDAGCRAMTDYIMTARMPWPAVACRDRARLTWLQRARGAALPGLLVYDRAGKLLINSWSRTGHSSPRKALNALERLAEPRTGRPRPSISR